MNIDLKKDTLEKLSLRPAFYLTQLVKFPVYLFNLKNIVDSEEIIKNISYDFNSNHKESLVKDGYQTNYFNRDELDCFKHLINVVEEKTSSISGIQYIVESYWYVVYKKDSSQNWHSHVKSPKEILKFSAVYYPQVNSNSAPIMFMNGTQQVFSYQPQKDDLLLFDSRLQHCVPKTTSSDLRLSFAFNLRVKK